MDRVQVDKLNAQVLMNFIKIHIETDDFQFNRRLRHDR